MRGVSTEYLRLYVVKKPIAIKKTANLMAFSLEYPNSLEFMLAVMVIFEYTRPETYAYCFIFKV